ncbi:hypothetical protein ANN_26839 [Periplaneta americana]|uniref:Transposase Tc1-like domain-containing protein n=1 Tax=Periplaneta americana TaxID=6978 RepID=A0ABQ8RZH8_PERAM|nr:hypothetical protein ANN_26839 [Periplaneta americana]
MATTGANIHVTTVRRRLLEAGRRARKPIKKQLLTPIMCKKRLMWAKLHQHWTVNNWKNVLFLMSLISRSTATVFLTYGKDPKKIVLQLQKSFPDGRGVFQQDLAPCHTSRKTTEFFNKKNIQIMEKKWENKGTVHQLFIDFKKAYDSVKREVLYDILIEFGIPKKLVRLIKMCLSETYSRVRIDGIVSIVKDELKANLDYLNKNFTTINETVAELRQEIDHFDGKIRDPERRQEQTSELLDKTSEVMDKHAEKNKDILTLMDRHAEENKHILALVDRQTREQKQIVAEEVRRVMQEAATELRTLYSGPEEPSPSARHHNVKTPKFDGTTSWAIFRRQFEAIAEHNGWTPAEKPLSCWPRFRDRRRRFFTAFQKIGQPLR